MLIFFKVIPPRVYFDIDIGYSHFREIRDAREINVVRNIKMFRLPNLVKKKRKKEKSYQSANL